MLDKSLQAAVKALGKKGIDIHPVSEQDNFKFCSTGLASLDFVIAGQGGGIPIGVITEIIGDSSTGKSLLVMSIIKQFQKAYPNRAVLLLDTESYFTPMRLNQMKVELDRLILHQPRTLEEAAVVADSLLKTGKVSLVVLDSIAAAVAEKKSKAAGENLENLVVRPGAKAASTSIWLDYLSNVLAEYKVAGVFVNQWRATWSRFTSSKTPTGGNALKYIKALSIKLRRKGFLKVGLQTIGIEVVAEVIKSKVGIPFGTVDLKLYFSDGFDALDALVDVLGETGFITIGKTGWISSDYIPDLKVRGRKNFLAMLKDDKEFFGTVENFLSTGELPALEEKTPEIVEKTAKEAVAEAKNILDLLPNEQEI